MTEEHDFFKLTRQDTGRHHLIQVEARVGNGRNRKKQPSSNLNMRRMRTTQLTTS